MEITIEVGIEPLVRRMKVSFSAATVDAETDKMVHEKAKTEHLPGFQPNKPLPYKVAKNYFGKRIRQYVLEEEMQKKFYEAVTEKKLKPAGAPKIEAISDAAGQISFSAEFEVYPELLIQNLDQLKIEKEVATISEADIDKMINTLRGQFAEWQAVDRPAQEGDEVILNFKGEIDGVAFAGGSADDVPLVLGSGKMIKGFESGLLGAKTGEKRDLLVTFPADYHGKDLAGKEAVFHAEITKVSTKDLPPIDADLAEKLGSKDVASLRQDILANMEREIKFALNDRLKTHVLEAIVKANAFDLPLSAIEFERQHIYMESLKRMGLQPEHLKRLPPPPEGMYVDEAIKRLKFSLIVDHFITRDEIKASPDAVKEMIKTLSSVYEKPTEVLDFYYESPDRLKEVEYMVLEDEVVKRIITECEMSEKSVNFFDIIQPKN